MGWNSVQELLEVIKQIDYVVLRNKETITEQFKEGEDWDILCKDKDEMVKIVQALPVTNQEKCFNYYTYVNGRKLLLDIRCIGDGYYDEQWEWQMLKNKEKMQRFYFLDANNYKYSILYHCLIHKTEIEAKKYDGRLLEMFETTDIQKHMEILVDYMKKNNYKLSMPEDKGVYVNRNNYDVIGEMING